MSNEPQPDYVATILPAPPDQQPAFVPSPYQAEPVQTGDPWDQNQAFKDLVQELGYSCPGSNVGDYAFTAWLYNFYLRASGGSAPAAAPTITSLTPDTGPANADITVAIAGTGFDPASVKVVVGASELTP